LRAARAELGCDAPYEIRAAAGEIHIDSGLVNACEKAIGAQGHFLDFPWTRERSEYSSAMPGNFRRVRSCLSAASNQRLNCLGQKVAHHQWVPSLLDVFCNCGADGSETDESNRIHFNTFENS
jgi:hypothetical protein